ncbi:unnamed protein product [Linum trigynum]
MGSRFNALSGDLSPEDSTDTANNATIPSGIEQQQRVRTGATKSTHSVATNNSGKATVEKKKEKIREVPKDSTREKSILGSKKSATLKATESTPKDFPYPLSFSKEKHITHASSSNGGEQLHSVATTSPVLATQTGANEMLARDVRPGRPPNEAPMEEHPSEGEMVIQLERKDGANASPISE